MRTDGKQHRQRCEALQDELAEQHAACEQYRQRILESCKELDQAIASEERVSASLCAQQAFTAVFQVCTAMRCTEVSNGENIKRSFEEHRVINVSVVSHL